LAASPLLLHVFSTFAPAGPQVRTVRLVNALGPAFRHAVVAMDGVDAARELVDPEISLEVLPPPSKAGSVRTGLRMRALVVQQAPALVLTYNWGAIDTLLGLRLGPPTPVLHHEDGFLPDEAERLKSRRVLARRALLTRAVGVVVPSERLASIARAAWHQPHERVHLIPNGIDLERFPTAGGNQELRERLDLPSDAFVVGFCGHLRPEKNPARLIEALTLMREPGHLIVVGDGPERPRLEAAARSGVLRGRIHLVGHQEDPRPYYRAMDVFALTSDTEQMPVALLEAMASALPVVATDVGDVLRMLPDGSSKFVVPLAGAATPAALAASLDALSAGPSLRQQLGGENRERVRATYSFDAMRRAHEALWRDLTGSS